MQPQSGKLEFNHGRLYYEVRGSGEPFVFIHGFTLDHRMWQPQVEYHSRRARVITYDARGFGRSSAPAGPYNHHDDLHALLDHLGVQSTHIVGLSMGGRVAVNFTLEYPARVLSLSLLDSALDDYNDPTDWNVHARTEGLDRAKQNWLNHPLFDGTRRHPEVVAALKPIVADYTGWHWLNRDPQIPRSTHAKRRLSEIRAKTVVVVGEQDLAYFRDIAHFLAANISGARLEVIPNAGHMVNMEAPDRVNRLLEQNLDP